MNEKYLFLEVYPDYIKLISKEKWMLQSVQKIENLLRQIPCDKKIVWDVSLVDEFDSADVVGAGDRGEGGDAVMGEWHDTGGDGLQDGRHVGFVEPKDPGSRPGHRKEPVDQGLQVGEDAAGAVVTDGGEPVGHDAAAAHAALLHPAFVAAASAGEVPDPAGAVGAPPLPVGSAAGQEPLHGAAVTHAIGFAGGRVAARAEHAVGPAPDHGQDLAAGR